ncbi:MAG: hypothetical protein WCK94_01840 [Comamonadaceae bacterium]|jgi:hypothetical protein
MLFKWFDATVANQFGAELARFFMERMPVGTQKNEKKFAVKTSELLSKLSLRLNQFKGANKLNFYTKAQLANNFKWTLKDAGYEPNYVDDLTEWLVKQL